MIPAADQVPPLRPPAVPLVTCDPYFSIWSFADRASDQDTCHWTGKPHRLVGLIRVDGAAYRLLGAQPAGLPALSQVGLEVRPTSTVYRFAGAGVEVMLVFMTPLLPHDLDLVARPVTYLTWQVRATDGRTHQVRLYLDAAAELAVNTPDQEVTWGREQCPGFVALRAGSQAQAVLARAGDDLRIEWGYLYLASPRAAQAAIGPGPALRESFVGGGELPEHDDPDCPRAAGERDPTLALAFDLGRVGTRPIGTWAMLAYDDLWSIELLGQRLRPYWRRSGMSAPELLARAAREYPILVRRAAAFDRRLLADLRAAGGERYARLAALAYRQCLAAHKLAAGPQGEPLFFSKECFSNGCIATVDVTYPASPCYLLFNPRLLRGTVQPILDYAASARWPHPFAPHDLGTYPLANGQHYGGGERTAENQMPVEECGNLLIMVAALAQVEGNADFAARYWPLLVRWAEYLRAQGLDPAHQLCTDDFAGHLAHNVNLSAKAIVALGCFARLCEMRGQAEQAAAWWQTAREFAARWQEMADDGDHYRLAFDRPGTWSQKYNLVWDRILNLGLFPPEVTRREVAWYLRQQQRYGLPLDNRADYTKLDWVVWTATLAESPQDFAALVAPAYDFADQSPSRVPLSDWYDTKTGKVVGFQARSVVGGVFVKMLTDRKRWEKWAKPAR